MFSGGVRDRRCGAAVRIPDKLRNRNQVGRRTPQNRQQQLRLETGEDCHVSCVLYSCCTVVSRAIGVGVAVLMKYLFGVSIALSVKNQYTV